MYPFPKQSKSIWLEKLSADLKGKEVASLNHNLSNDIKLSPFYHLEDLSDHHQPLRNNNAWEIAQKIDVTDFAQANQEALFFLANGVEALHFDTKKDVTQEDLSILLKEINLEYISISFDQVTNWSQFTSALSQFLNSQDNSLSNLKLQCLSDHTIPPDNILSSATNYKQYKVRLENAISENLSDAIAQLLFESNSIFKQFHKEAAWNYTMWSIPVTDVYFLNIACLRAIRLMLQKIILSYQPQWTDNLFIQSEMAPFPSEQHIDTNKISATARAASAICGGANRVFVNTGDNELSNRRLDQNIQQILKLESYLDHVGDPSAGSYYIENATQMIIDQTWPKFQNLERNHDK